MLRRDHVEAERLALEARALAVDGPVGAYPATAVAHAAAALIFLRRGGGTPRARELLEAEPLLQHLTQTLPWLAVETLLALAAAYVALRDHASARARLADLDDLVARHECLDGFRAQIGGLRRKLDELPDDRDGRSIGPDAAELRLLPLLATHLSFREIGERLFVSRNTIKTQAISVYRKLGVIEPERRDRAGGASSGSIDDARSSGGLHPAGMMYARPAARDWVGDVTDLRETLCKLSLRDGACIDRVIADDRGQPGGFPPRRKDARPRPPRRTGGHGRGNAVLRPRDRSGAERAARRPTRSSAA